jgi:hypothetical protein
MSGLGAEFGLGSLFCVAIAYPFGGLLCGRSTRIASDAYADEGLGIGSAAKFDKFGCAELVSFGLLPYGVRGYGGSVLLGCCPGSPVVAGGVISSGPADYGWAQFFEGLDYIGAKPLLIRVRGLWIVDSAVDHILEMFEEVAEDKGRHTSDGFIDVDGDGWCRVGV